LRKGLTYFNPHSLKHTVEKSGLIINSLSTNESFSGWFLAVLRTLLGVNRSGSLMKRRGGRGLERIKETKSIIFEHPYRFAMLCAGLGLWPLRYIQTKWGFGDEVICNACKPNQG
jgi:hypothetical protein